MIKVISRQFQNPITGTVTNVYKANAGDIINCAYTVQERVYVKNLNGVQFTYDFGNFEIIAVGLDWISEGFQVGDNVRLNTYDATGAIVVQQDRVITGLTTTVMTLNALTSFDTTFLVDIEGFPVKRDALNIFFNHATSLTTSSPIDGEKTGFKIDGLSTAPSGVNALTQFGKRSGQFEVKDVTIEEKFPLFEGGGTYEIRFKIIQSGVYDANLFNPNLDFNLVVAFQFFRIDASPSTSQTLVDDFQSNLGYFNQGFSDEPSSGLVTQFFPELYYNATAQVTAKITTTGTFHGMGACYIPIDGDYYQNQIGSQSDYGMIIETQSFTASQTRTGDNPLDALTPSYDLQLVSQSTASGVMTIVANFTPAFNTFMDNKDGDRRFVVWVKVGNTNHLVFDNQLKKKPTPNTIFDPVFAELAPFDRNIDVATQDFNREFTIEDNLSFLVNVPMAQNETFESIKCRVYLEKNSDNSFFDLNTITFPLANQQQVNGAYVVAQTQQVPLNLASGSVKNVAKCVPTALSGSAYEFQINYPFLIDWRYWLSLPIFYDFYPNLNKDWFNFVNANYAFYVEVQKLASDGSYQYTRLPLTFSDYDEDGDLDTSIIIKRADGTVVSNVLDEPMTIEVTVVNNAGNTIDEELEFTIEPKESSPRWQVCTAYGETNVNNPLTITSVSTVLNTTIAVLQLDTTKLDISNGVSISAEILCAIGVGTGLQKERYKETFEYAVLPKFLDEEDRGLDECCEPQIKVASSTSTDKHKNDVTAVYYRTDGVGGSLSFYVEKDGVSVYAIPMNATTKEPNGRFGMVHWRDILLANGVGCYKIKAQGSVSSVAFDATWGVYLLMQYSLPVVRRNTRVRTYFNKYSSVENLDFEGSGIYDDVRVDGFFGEMQPKTVTDFIVYSNREQKIITNENKPSYQWTTEYISTLFAKLIQGNLLKATDIFMSDYNVFNTDYYEMENVILNEENPISIEYQRGTRKRLLNVSYLKKKRDERTYKK